VNLVLLTEFRALGKFLDENRLTTGTDRQAKESPDATVVSNLEETQEGSRLSPRLAVFGCLPRVVAVIGFLRWIGLLNAAVWFGAAVYSTFVVSSAMSAPEMIRLTGAAHYHYLSGAVAHIIRERQFTLELVCGIIALFHLLGERLYFGRGADKWRLRLLFALLALTLFEGFIVQSRMGHLHENRYNATMSAAAREEAAVSFGKWRRVHQGLSALMLVGLGIYAGKVPQREG
jgi:hypothetical protein